MCSPVLTIMALWQRLGLDTGCSVTHCDLDCIVESTSRVLKLRPVSIAECPPGCYIFIYNNIGGREISKTCELFQMLFLSLRFCPIYILHRCLKVLKMGGLFAFSSSHFDS